MTSRANVTGNRLVIASAHGSRRAWELMRSDPSSEYVIRDLLTGENYPFPE